MEEQKKETEYFLPNPNAQQIQGKSQIREDYEADTPDVRFKAFFVRQFIKGHILQGQEIERLLQPEMLLHRMLHHNCGGRWSLRGRILCHQEQDDGRWDREFGKQRGVGGKALGGQ